MAFANDQTVTVGTDEVTLSRVFTGTQTGLFKSADGSLEIEVTPSVSKNGRRHTVARLRRRTTTEDPLVGTVNIRVEDYVSLNINRPSDGISDADAIELAGALTSWLDPANLAKLVNGQN